MVARKVHVLFNFDEPIKEYVIYVLGTCEPYVWGFYLQ
jgi:hypothetical protein